jgi:endoglucanase
MSVDNHKKKTHRDEETHIYMSSLLSRAALFLLVLLSDSCRGGGSHGTANAFTVGPNGSLVDGRGHALQVRGISWFGMETPDRAPNGLWTHNMTFYMDLLADEGFNVLRVPFSAEWAVGDFDAYPDQSFVRADPEHQHKKSVDILDSVFDKARERNMLVLLDLHRLNWQYISELWYDPNDGRFTADEFYAAWFALLDRYHDHPALWGVDLLNEPHGRATWGDGNPATDWRAFAEEAIARIEQRYAGTPRRWVYLVEGVGWGKDLSRAGQHPVRPPPSAAKRVSYSAHNYGRSVVPGMDVHNVGWLHQDWDAHFGYLGGLNQSVVTGEWGGMTSVDRDWMQHYVDYLRATNMPNAFFWSLGPNSGDVQGYLLDDWTSVDPFKREVTQALQPDPSPRARTRPAKQKNKYSHNI